MNDDWPCRVILISDRNACNAVAVVGDYPSLCNNQLGIGRRGGREMGKWAGGMEARPAKSTGLPGRLPVSDPIYRSTGR